MRATTLSTPNVSRATRAARMLELSPLLTAAKASAPSIPAASSTSRSKPDAGHRPAVEALGQPLERAGLLVDDGDRVPLVLEGHGE